MTPRRTVFELLRGADRPTSTAEISDTTQIPHGTVANICTRLVNAGVVSRRYSGARAGYVLNVALQPDDRAALDRLIEAYGRERLHLEVEP